MATRDVKMECCPDTQIECTPGSESELRCNQTCIDICGAIRGQCKVDNNVQYCHCICP